MRLLILFFCLIPVISYAQIKADRVLVEKSIKTLSLYRRGELISTFPVVFGKNPQGHKQQSGDERTPEGIYSLNFKVKDSRYYKAIHVSYPNAQDIANAKKLGVSPGGDIMIHGQKGKWGWAYFISKFINWTDGCIALSNSNMDIVWASVEVNTPIEIRP